MVEPPSPDSFLNLGSSLVQIYNKVRLFIDLFLFGMAASGAHALFIQLIRSHAFRQLMLFMAKTKTSNLNVRENITNVAFEEPSLDRT